MIFDWSKVTEWLKLKPYIVAAIALATAFMILAPDSVLARLGLEELVRNHRGWFGAGMVGSTALLLTQTVKWVVADEHSSLRVWWETQRLKTFLRTLSPPEKAILKKYIDGTTTTLYFELSDGVIGGLVKKRILWRASNVGMDRFAFPYNVQPWAWEYLLQNPRVLD